MKRLTERKDWVARQIAEVDTKSLIKFDPNLLMFRETHKVLNKNLPIDNSVSVLEVGAYPGEYLWYFHKYFGYEPWGIEYVAPHAESAQKALTELGVPAKIICDDFFNFDLKSADRSEPWGVVVSFGFVEHFDDVSKPVQRHLDMTKSGGFVVISIPNHAGLSGLVMKWIDKDKAAQHNYMSLRDLEKAFQAVGGNKIVFSGCLGHIGFWNSCLYENVKKWFGPLYPFIRAPFWLVEQLGQYLVPNNSFTSPVSLIIVRKSDRSAESQE